MELTLEPDTEADPKVRPWSLPKLWMEETDGRGRGRPLFSAAPSESKQENPEEEPPAPAATAAGEEKSLLTLGEFRERISSKLWLGLSGLLAFLAAEAAAPLLLMKLK